MTRTDDRITFQTAVALGLQWPGVQRGTAYGSPALTVDGLMFACVPVNRSVEPNTLAVRVSLGAREDLLTEAPDIYYVTDHYVEHPIVLVRLSRVRREALADLLRMGYDYVRNEKRRSPDRNRLTTRPRRRP